MADSGDDQRSEGSSRSTLPPDLSWAAEDEDELTPPFDVDGPRWDRVPYGDARVLGEVRLRPADRPAVMVSIEHRDAFATRADLLVLKYAQGSYGADQEAVRRVAVQQQRRMAMPSEGERLEVHAGAAAAADIIRFIGTPPIARLSYEAVAAWARMAVTSHITRDARARGVEPRSIVTTVHGVENHDLILDETRTLRTQLTGFLAGLEQSPSTLRWIRIVERDRDRAERLAGALPGIARLESGIELVTLSRFTNDVYRLRDKFAGDAQVTASLLASQLRMMKAGLAGGTFAQAVLDTNVGPIHPVDRWLERVRQLYPGDLHPTWSSDPWLVIDEPMFLAGLLQLDRHLRQALDAAGVVEPLWAELKVKPSEPHRREEVAWLPDTPAGADRLGRRLVATALGERLIECAEEHPGQSFLVHIDGPWGAGKSTLLKFLVDYTRERPWRCCVVEFDAWRQARAGPPWLLLLSALRSALQRDGYPSAWSKMHEHWRLLGLRYQVAALTCLALLSALAGLWATGATDFDTASSATLGALALVGGLWAASKAIGRVLVFYSRRGAATYVDTRHDPMEELARHFQWLRRQCPGPLLLIIDDLDRCDHEYVVELLDSTQKLLRDLPVDRPGAQDDLPPSLFVVVAADGRWLRQAYELIHEPFVEAVGEPGRPLGSLFLDKLFQLRVPVPQLSPVRQEALLRSIVQDLEDAESDRRGKATNASTAADVELQEQLQQAESSEEVLTVWAMAPTEQRIRAAPAAWEQLQSRHETEHTLTRFAQLLEPNPRSVLRFAMAFDILRAARLAEGSPVPANRLALWSIVSTRWPTLAEMLQRSPEAVELFREAGDDLADRIPADLQRIFANPDPEIRRVFNHTDGGPISAAVIRECAGVG